MRKKQEQTGPENGLGKKFSRQEKQRQKQHRYELSREWQADTEALYRAKEDLERLYATLENVVEEKLVDSIIYQIKAAEACYDFHYLQLQDLEKRIQGETAEPAPAAPLREKSRVG